MKRVLAAFASIVLLAWIAFHAMVIVSLVQSEVIPALAAGSFNIQTSSMILNRVWEGNELLLALSGARDARVDLGGCFCTVGEIRNSRQGRAKAVA